MKISNILKYSKILKEAVDLNRFNQVLNTLNANKDNIDQIDDKLFRNLEKAVSNLTVNFGNLFDLFKNAGITSKRNKDVYKELRRFCYFQADDKLIKPFTKCLADHSNSGVSVKDFPKCKKFNLNDLISSKTGIPVEYIVNMGDENGLARVSGRSMPMRGSYEVLLALIGKDGKLGTTSSNQEASGDISIEGKSIEIKADGGRIGSQQKGFNSLSVIQQEVEKELKAFTTAIWSIISSNREDVTQLTDSYNTGAKELSDRTDLALAYNANNSLDLVLIQYINDCITAVPEMRNSASEIVAALKRMYTAAFSAHIPNGKPQRNEYSATINSFIPDDLNTILAQGRFFNEQEYIKLITELAMIDLNYYHQIEKFHGFICINSKQGTAIYIDFEKPLDKIASSLITQGINISPCSISKGAGAQGVCFAISLYAQTPEEKAASEAASAAKKKAIQDAKNLKAKQEKEKMNAIFAGLDKVREQNGGKLPKNWNAQYQSITGMPKVTSAQKEKYFAARGL